MSSTSIPISLSRYDSRNEEVLNSMEIRRVGFMLSNNHSIIRVSLSMKKSNVKAYLPMRIVLQRLYIVEKVFNLFDFALRKVTCQ